MCLAVEILKVKQAKQWNKLLELGGTERFRKAICYHWGCGNALECDCSVVYQLASPVVSDGNVFGLSIVLWVFGKPDSALVICMDNRRESNCAAVAILEYSL